MIPGRRSSICYVEPGMDLLPGSVQSRHALGLARALAAHADVTLAFRRVAAPLAGEPFDVVAIEPSGTPGAGESAPSRRALGAFVEGRCAGYGALIEGSWSLTGKLTAWCAQRGIPAVPVIERQPPAAWLAPLEAGGSWLGLGTAGRYLRRAPVVIARSHELKATIARRWRVHPDQIVVIGAGVDRGRLAPGDQAEARRRLGLAPEHRILLAGGALDRTRDLAPVIEAVPRVGDPSLRLHVLGHGERRADLERLAGSAGPVTFHDPVDDEPLSRFLAAADLCIAVEPPHADSADASYQAAFSVPECLAAGRPVAVGAEGDVHPLVRHLVSGFLIEHDLVAWIRFLQRDCPSRNTLQLMGKAAAATPVDGLDQMAARYLEAIERARRAMVAGAPAG